MAYVDTVVNPYSLPGPARGPFDNSSNPKLALSHDLTTPQNPVTLLNLAVQVRRIHFYDFRSLVLTNLFVETLR